MRLSRSALVALLRIFILCELIGTWPCTIGDVHIVLLPKAAGGFRPIGLFPSLIRLWMRLRLPLAQAWQASCDEPFFFAGAGKAAGVAAWKHCLRAELAAHAQADFATVLLDVVKCFEFVPHDTLCEESAAIGYPLALLRLTLAAYRLERRIGIQGVFSLGVLASRGITAGFGFATIELRVLLLRSLRRMVAASPGVALSVYVDDLTLESAGRPAVVTKVRSST